MIALDDFADTLRHQASSAFQSQASFTLMPPAIFAWLGIAPAGPLAWLAGLVQVILGIALILGIATRYAGLASFVWALASIAIAQRYWSYPASEAPTIYHSFLKNFAIMGGALYAFAVGAGRYSLDAMLARR